MASTWLKTPGGRVWEVREGSEEAKRLLEAGARKVPGPAAPKPPPAPGPKQAG